MKLYKWPVHLIFTAFGRQLKISLVTSSVLWVTLPWQSPASCPTSWELSPWPCIKIGCQVDMLHLLTVTHVWVPTHQLWSSLWIVSKKTFKKNSQNYGKIHHFCSWIIYFYGPGKNGWVCLYRQLLQELSGRSPLREKCHSGRQKNLCPTVWFQLWRISISICRVMRCNECGNKM